MSANKTEDAAERQTPLSLMGCGVLFGVLIMVLDFFDVSFADGRGPGSAVIIFGLGIFALVLEGLHTGAPPTLRGFRWGEVGFLARRTFARRPT